MKQKVHFLLFPKSLFHHFFFNQHGLFKLILSPFQNLRFFQAKYFESNLIIKKKFLNSIRSLTLETSQELSSLRKSKKLERFEYKFETFRVLYAFKVRPF